MEIKMGVIIGAAEAKIGKISVKAGQSIEKDEVLLQYETKKGNRNLKSPVEGVINKVFFQEGETIKKDDVLFEITEAQKQVTATSTNVTEIFMTPIVGAQDAKVGKIEVSCGEFIEKDQVLFNYETKKGNRPFKSTVSGQITEIFFEEWGTELGTGQLCSSP